MEAERRAREEEELRLFEEEEQRKEEERQRKKEALRVSWWTHDEAGRPFTLVR